VESAFEAEDEGNDAIRQKYLSLAADAYHAFLVVQADRDVEWWVAQIRLADIARQQGRFAAAIAVAVSLAGETPPGDGWLGSVAKQIRSKAEAGDAAPAAAE